MSSTKTESFSVEIYRGEHYCDGVLRGLKNLLDNKQLCDVVLVAGNDDKRIDAHRLLLSGASEYFSAMFCGPMRESKELEVKLQDITGDALDLFVNYFYTGCVELRQDTVQSVLIDADIFLLNDLVAACWNFMERHLDATNCLGFAFFAEQRSYEKLEKSAKTFVYHNFVKVCQNDEFFQLNFKQLTEIIASDKLTVPSEEDVFRCVLKWIEHNSEARKEHFDDLLRLVRLRLPLLKPAFIVNFVKPICITQKNKELLLDTVLCRLQPELNECLKINNRIRSGVSSLLAVDREEFNIQCYCQLTNKWTRWNTPSYECTSFAVAVLADNIMLVGGLHKDDEYTQRVTSLNLNTKTLTEFASLEIKRYKHGVAPLHGSLYAIGGFIDEDDEYVKYEQENDKDDGNGRRRSVERWDPKTCRWSLIESMITRRCDFGVAVLNKHLYVVGGVKNSHSLNCVEFYNPITKVWKNAASMNVARYHHGVAVVNDLLYAVGGNVNCFSMERYDPHTDIWTIINTTNAPHFKNNARFSCTTLEGCLVISNGQSGLYEYDTIKEKWRKLPQYDSYKHQVDLVTIPYKFTMENPKENSM